VVARLYRNRERNGAASRDPRDERERNSEHDEHDDGAGGVEAFVLQKDGEAAGVKNQPTDQNVIAV